MTDASLPFSRYITKGSHNSYQRNEQVVTQATTDLPQRYNLRCGCIELDINQSRGDPMFFSVNHGDRYNQLDRGFSQFLSELRVWSHKHPDHPPVTIFSDVRSVRPGGDFSAEVDAFIGAHLSLDINDVDATVLSPRSLYQRYGVPADGMPLRDLLQTHGWPTLDEMRGKFLIVFTGEYGGLPSERLCFRSINLNTDDVDTSQPIQSIVLPDIVFFNTNFGEAKDKSKRETVLQRLYAEAPETITRAFTLNAREAWLEAFQSRVNILATNNVNDHDWAWVQPDGEVYGLPTQQ